MDFLSFPQSRPLGWELRFNRQTLKTSSKGGNFWPRLNLIRWTNLCMSKQFQTMPFSLPHQLRSSPNLSIFTKPVISRNVFYKSVQQSILNSIHTIHWKWKIYLKIVRWIENEHIINFLWLIGKSSTPLHRREEADYWFLWPSPKCSFPRKKLRPRQNQGQGNWLLIGLVSHLVSSVIMHYVPYVRSNGWQCYKRFFVQTNNQFISVYKIPQEHVPWLQTHAWISSVSKVVLSCPQTSY